MDEIVAIEYEAYALSGLLLVAVMATSIIIFKHNNPAQLISRSSLKDIKTMFKLFFISLLVLLNMNLIITFVSQLFIDIQTHYNLVEYYSHTFNLRHSPISEEVTKLHFKPVELLTFSNMEDHFDIDVSFPKQKKFDEEELSEFFTFKCPKISFYDKNSLSSSTEMTKLDVENEMLKIRNLAIDMYQRNEYPLLQYAFDDHESETLEYILERKWFKFCSAPVWMDKYGVYIVINRVTYCPSKNYKSPKLSLLYAQILDKDWNELEDYTIDDIHGEPIVFPAIFPASMDDVGDKQFLGPEDPRIIIRDYFNEKTQKMDQEPVIIFNTISKKLKQARAMHIYRPFTHRTRVRRFDIHAVKHKPIEKNWAPFFSTDKEYIYFLYSFLPFRIIKCNIDSGICHTVTGPEVDPEASGSELSGSTNLMEIPSNLLPSDLAKHRKLWFGIIRSHIHGCGCMDHLYRFHAILISTRVDDPNDKFTIDYTTSLLDFNINPESFETELEDYKCEDGKSVLIPNSIAYWDFIPKNMTNEENQYGEDIMGIAYSEADEDNKVIHVKGWLKHLTKMLDGDRHKFKTHYLRESKNNLESNFISQCSVIGKAEYCKSAEKKYEWLSKPFQTDVKFREEAAKKEKERLANERAKKILLGQMTPNDLEALEKNQNNVS